MKSNVGTVDRVIRFFLGLALIVAPYVNFMNIGSSVALSYGTIILGVVLVATAFLKFCPLYRLIGVSTCRT